MSLYFSTKHKNAGSQAEMLSYIQTRLLADSLSFTRARIQTAPDTCKKSWKKNGGFHAGLGAFVNMNLSPQVHFRTDYFSLETWLFPETVNSNTQPFIANHTFRNFIGVDYMGGYRLCLAEWLAVPANGGKKNFTTCRNYFVNGLQTADHLFTFVNPNKQLL